MGGRPAGLLWKQAHLVSVCSLTKCLLRTCTREPIKSSPSQPKQEENTGTPCLSDPNLLCSPDIARRREPSVLFHNLEPRVVERVSSTAKGTQQVTLNRSRPTGPGSQAQSWALVVQVSGVWPLGKWSQWNTDKNH